MLRFKDYSAPAVDVLLSRLAGVRTAGAGRWMALCPAHPDRTPSLSIALTGDRLLLHCFAGCAPDAVLEALGLTWRDLHSDSERRPWDAPSYYRPAPAAPVAPTPDAELQARWSRWWDGASPGHPLLRCYLRARALTLEPPPSLRLAVWESAPVMLARVTAPDGALTGMHLTALEPGGTGRLYKRLAKGSHPIGGAIQLYPPEDGKPLSLSEGIETALAVHQATGWPVWACVSAGGLERVALPLEAREVVVCADHDKAGLEAANRLARRLLTENRKVRVATPPVAGKDWLDVVAGEVA